MGQFIHTEYTQAGGEVLQGLLEEATLLTNANLVQETLEKKLNDIADAKCTELGMAWSIGMIDGDYNDLSKYGQIYKKPLELDDETQKTVDALTADLTANNAKFEALEDSIQQMGYDDPDYETKAQDLENLETADKNLNEQIHDLSNGYSAEDKSKAGVIANWVYGRLDLNIGLVRPEDRKKVTTDSQPESEASDNGPKISQKMQLDLGKERTLAMQIALAKSPKIARDFADFLLVKDLLTNSYSNHESCNFSAKATIFGNNEAEGSLKALLDTLTELREHLKADYSECQFDNSECFKMFVDLPQNIKDQLVAFQVAITLEPSSPNGEIKTARDVVEGQVLPNIRDSWTPDETFFKRLRKPDLLSILAKDLKMPQQAIALNSDKKSAIVEYMVSLFEAPFATLTQEQTDAVNQWAPDLMQTPAPVTDDSEAKDVEGQLAA